MTVKTQLPSDLRITDRRGKDRRYVGEPMALSRGYLWGIFGLFAIVLGALGFLLLRPAPHSDALRWLVPATFSGAAAETGGAPVANLFDGKRSTAWASPAAKEEAEIEFAFPGKVLVTGIALETGYLNADGSASAYAYPKSVVLEAEGRKPVRLNLAETDGAQYLALGGLLLQKGKLRFSAAAPGSPAPKPMAVREVRFLGLLYD